ncbi:V-type ATP synthase subunit D [Motiliproteus sp. SC1-56]|uniref:V-type ATP synthase subunit D n=1 Tax=Motiliproteus sp. SC1-56 TaxID=2799565 RepID=UPI001A8FA364|nr:V-type ATP synthase subunit D [Motiliproteus sp. SC1-56]
MPGQNQRPSTKAELVRLKAELKVARDGVGLLERKRDLLMAEGIARLREARAQRRALTADWETLWMHWEAARKQAHSARLGQLAARVAPLNRVADHSHPWMSTRRAAFQLTPHELDLLGTPSEVGIAPEQVRGELKSLLPPLLELMALETNVRRIAVALKRCHRQVNALNRVVIPELSAQRRRVEQRLEEKEREAIFQVKRLKARSQ